MKASGRCTCPGCGLLLRAQPEATYDGYYCTSAECWAVYTEVLGAEFGDAVLFGQVHQLTVDSYAVQHPGGAHPDKSIGVHLTGLHLVLDRGLAPTLVPRFHQHLANGAIARRADSVVHLHGLNHQQIVTHPHALTGADCHRDNGTG